MIVFLGYHIIMKIQQIYKEVCPMTANISPDALAIIKKMQQNEITESAIKEAVQQPDVIDMDKVEAQQARRILDRVVGYQLSPLLWKKIRRFRRQFRR